MSKPYRPILPPKAGYVEQDGHYVKIPTEQDAINESLSILLGGDMENDKSVASEKAAVLCAAQIIVQRQSNLLTDAEALAVPSAFEVWGPDMKYGKDQIIQHPKDGQLYRVAQAVEKSQAHQPPGGEGMLAVYRPIVKGHDGTLSDPIPFVYGMDCRTGIYYSYNGKVYLCKGDMLPCTWPPGTAGLWQWEKVA